MSLGSSTAHPSLPQCTHIVQNIHNLHLARNGFEALYQFALHQFLYNPVDGRLRVRKGRRAYSMQPRANLDLSNPNALISRPFDALVHEHFRVSQVIQLRLLGNLIVRRQAKHVAVRTLQDL